MTRRDGRALAALLEEAGREAAFPETPPLAERVRTRIESGPLPVASIHLPRTRPPLLRPVLAVICVAALALGLTLTLSVTARRAVADFLGVVGIRVTFDDDPGVTARPLEEIPLGEPVTRGAASRRAGFRVLVPAGEDSPAFYFDRHVAAHGMVSVVYPRDAATLADVDLLVTQFAASVREEFVKKIGMLGSEIRYVAVRDSDAYWISGDPHYFFYEQRNGFIRQETVRLAGNVLLWEEDGVTYRIEGAGSLRAARRLAESLR